MGSSSVTMKDIAHLMGVSVTTVSNAYNKPDRLSAELREKILTIGKQMGYCGPSAAGRLLRSGKANAIGVIAGSGYSFSLRDPYALELFTAMSQVFEERGVALTLLPTGRDGNETTALSTAVVDGLVCITSHRREARGAAIALAEQRGLRIVYGEMLPDVEYVAMDDRAAGRLMAHHLQHLGHTRVRLLVLDPDSDHVEITGADYESVTRALEAGRGTAWVEQRAESFVEVFGTNADLRVVVIPAKEGALAEAIALTLDQPEPATALVCMSDRLALQTLDVVEARGLRPGVDVSVTGFDGIPDALERGLTTVHQPISEKGRLSAELILDPKPTKTQILIPATLIPGRTAGPAPSPTSTSHQPTSSGLK